MRIHSYKSESIGGKPYIFVVVTLPEWAPIKRVEQAFPEGDEPDIENRPPSEVLPLLEARAKRAWIDSAREKAKAHEWCRGRMGRLDALWAEQRINSIQGEMERLQKAAARLRNDYLEVVQCGECGELGPDIVGVRTPEEVAHESKFHKPGCGVLDALKAQVGGGQSDRMCDIQARTFMHQVKDPEYPIEWIEDANGPRCTAFAPGVP